MIYDYVLVIVDCIVSVHYKESDFELGRCDVHRGKRHADETKELEYKIKIQVEEPSVTVPDETTQVLSTQSSTTLSSTTQSSTTRSASSKSPDEPLSSSVYSMVPGDKNLNNANSVAVTNIFIGAFLSLLMF